MNNSGMSRVSKLLEEAKKEAARLCQLQPPRLPQQRRLHGIGEKCAPALQGVEELPEGIT